MSPGEIYIADTPTGTRPVIIVSRAELNRGTYVVAVLCTSARYQVRSALPNCVPFQAGEFGFTKDSVAQCEAITFLRKTDIHVGSGVIDVLRDDALRDVIRAVGNVLDADCEPL